MILQFVRRAAVCSLFWFRGHLVAHWPTTPLLSRLPAPTSYCFTMPHEYGEDENCSTPDSPSSRNGLSQHQEQLWMGTNREQIGNKLPKNTSEIGRPTRT